MRTIIEEDIRGLKSATEDSYRLGGGVTGFANSTRVAVANLSKYASKNAENMDLLIPIDIAVEADRRAQSPVIVSAMAHLLGYRLVPDEEQLDDQRAINEADVSAFTKEFSDVLMLLAQARANGTLGTACVAKKLTIELHELGRELTELARNATVKPTP